MSLKTISKWTLCAALLLVGIQAANARLCKCGADTREYQIVKTDKGSAVRVWVVNYCQEPAYVLVNVVATAADDGALLRSDKPVRLNPGQRMPVDVLFQEEIGVVSYWFATRLGGAIPI